MTVGLEKDPAHCSCSALQFIDYIDVSVPLDLHQNALDAGLLMISNPT